MDERKKHASSLIGLSISMLCLIVFGSENFMIPSMIAVLGSFIIFKTAFERGNKQV